MRNYLQLARYRPISDVQLPPFFKQNRCLLCHLLDLHDANTSALTQIQISDLKMAIKMIKQKKERLETENWCCRQNKLRLTPWWCGWLSCSYKTCKQTHSHTLLQCLGSSFAISFKLRMTKILENQKLYKGSSKILSSKVRTQMNKSLNVKILK